MVYSAIGLSAGNYALIEQGKVSEQFQNCWCATIEHEYLFNCEFNRMQMQYYHLRFIFEKYFQLLNRIYSFSMILRNTKI